MSGQKMADYFKGAEKGIDRIVFDQLGCDKDWFEKFKNTDMTNEKKASRYFDNLHDSYLNIAEQMTDAEDELIDDNKDHHLSATQKANLNLIYTALIKKADSLHATIGMTVSMYLYHVKRIPEKYVAVISKNILEEVWYGPLSLNIRSKTKSFLSCYALWKIDESTDFSDMEKENKKALDEYYDYAEQAVTGFPDIPQFIN